MQKNKQTKKKQAVDFGVKKKKKKKKLVLLLPGLWNGIWWGPRCEHFMLEEAGQGVTLKAWCQSVPITHTFLLRWDEMRWDEWQFYAILQTLMQSVLQKKWWCVRKRYSSNFLNDKIVIVILIGLWLSQAGSMDTISWMIKMYLFFHLYTFLLKICLSFIGHFAEVYASYESSRAKMYLIPTGPQSLKVVKDTLLIRFCHQNIHLKFHESFSGFFFFFLSCLSPH